MLGPTNTGKTWTALERMQEHATGMIGFPRRLLARENYDRLVRERGATVTGEERIVPPHPRYWVCTVEAMPVDLEVDFLAIDEIQLCADRERGHVFTDRVMHARDRAEAHRRNKHHFSREPLVRKCLWERSETLLPAPRGS